MPLNIAADVWKAFLIWWWGCSAYILSCFEISFFVISCFILTLCSCVSLSTSSLCLFSCVSLVNRPPGISVPPLLFNAPSFRPLCFLCCLFLSPHRVYLNLPSDSFMLFLVPDLDRSCFVVGLLPVFCCRYFGFWFLDSLHDSSLFVVNPPASVSAFGSSFFVKHDAGQSELCRWKYQFGLCLLFLKQEAISNKCRDKCGQQRHQYI